MAKKVYLIVGSTRQNRIGKQVADWVTEHAAPNAGIDLEVVDLKDWNLPLFDKPYSPAYTEKLDDDIQAWANKIDAAEAFIFVTAEYNRGVPAPLKSAIDHLGKQWGNKPAAIVSYGYIDGGQSATKHLQDIFAWLKMPVVEPTVALKLEQSDVQDGAFADIHKTLAPFEAAVTSAVDALAQA